jgi:hypothetical protein
MERNSHPQALKPFVLPLCRLIMPGIIVTLLIITPIFVTRQVFLHSSFLDWLVRLRLTAHFCRAYWAIPDFPERVSSRRNAWENAIWLKTAGIDGGYWFRPLYLLNAVGYSVLAGIVMLWALLVFVPVLGLFSYLVVVINGLMLIVLMLFQYDEFKSAILDIVSTTK